MAGWSDWFSIRVQKEYLRLRSTFSEHVEELTVGQNYLQIIADISVAFFSILNASQSLINRGDDSAIPVRV